MNRNNVLSMHGSALTGAMITIKWSRNYTQYRGSTYVTHNIPLFTEHDMEGAREGEEGKRRCYPS